ncbi:iron-containing alcohol dehydrogenase [Fervidobacterium islandicum]|uniref:iron-containing alcohol dehydrogenase n=1 Tax=Fervidobacterium islandicum TaxID=2423 RepID=UPI003A68E2C2
MFGTGQFQLYNPVRVIYGKGELKRAAEIFGISNVLIVCDPYVSTSEYFKEAMAGFNSVFIYNKIIPNPPCELIDEIIESVYEHSKGAPKFEGVIGIGGGSTLDTAKAVSSLLVSEGKLADYVEGKKKFEKRLPLMLIPTTSGTGSEVTNVGVYTLNDIKKPMTSPTFWADIALVDPVLTYSMPKRVAATTGLDALTHAIESYWATSTQPYTEGLALRSAKMIFESYEASLNGEEWAKDEMAIAATIAGIAFSQTRTTAAHAISFPITSFYNVEHGLACALTLPTLIRWTYKFISEKMDDFVRYVGFKDVEELAKRIEHMMEYSGFSLKLHDYGVKEDELEKIAKVSVEANIINLTPGNPKYEDVLEILKTIY